MDVQKAHRPIVVGVDGSKAAERAVRWAAHEAQRRHVPVRVVQAVGWAPPLHQYTDRSFGPDPRAVLVGAAREELAAAAKVAAAAAPDVVVEQQVLDGFPVPRLIDEAATAQLVVVGDRGRGGVVGLLLGSVAATLAARGACPVVVVRGIEPPEGPVVVGIDGSPLSSPRWRRRSRRRRPGRCRSWRCTPGGTSCSTPRSPCASGPWSSSRVARNSPSGSPAGPASTPTCASGGWSSATHPRGRWSSSR